MQVKICGISDPITLEFLTEHPHSPKFIGFIVNYPKSRRYVEINKLKDLLKIDKKNSSYVAVLVKPDTKILEEIKNLPFDYYQVYDCDPKEIKDIKEIYNKKIITAFTVQSLDDVKKYSLYSDVSDIFLFDSKGYEKSMSFEHELIKNIKFNKEVMLAGNIQVNDELEKFKKIADIIDISGGVETSGVKDVSKIEIFLNKIKKNIPLIDQHDKFGFWGGKFGGSFIPETIKKPVEDLTKEFQKLRKNKKFLKQRDYYFKNYIGSPTSFVKLENLSNHLGGAQIWAKVVSEANGGAHKIYNATVHALICKAMGKKYIVGDTGAGYAGKMLSMAAKKFGLKCKIFMGAKDIKRQKPNCDAMRKNGAEIVSVYSGSQTLVDAVSECMRYWVSNCDNTHMCVGSTVGPNVFVKICGWSTAQISRELKVQLKKEFKKIPKKIKLINCVGGGSSAYGFWSEFIDYDKKQIELVGVEAGGPKNSKLHAAPLSRNAKIGILHGAASYVCQNNEGQIQETKSISAGLDYPGVSPIHCFLKDTKRARYTYTTDEDALDAHQMVIKFENLNPSLEPSHAFAEAIKIAPKLSKDTIIIVNSCGDAKKDRDILKERLGKKR